MTNYIPDPIIDTGEPIILEYPAGDTRTIFSIENTFGQVISSDKQDSMLDFIEKRSDIDLSSADFQNHYLSDVNFSGRDLSFTDFRGAILRYANFSGCKLKCTIFDNADLTGADITNCDFSECLLNKTILRAANISEATFLWCEKAFLHEILHCAAGKDIDKLKMAGLFIIEGLYVKQLFGLVKDPLYYWMMSTLYNAMVIRFRKEKSPHNKMAGPIQKWGKTQSHNMKDGLIIEEAQSQEV